MCVCEREGESQLESSTIILEEMKRQHMTHMCGNTKSCMYPHPDECTFTVWHYQLKVV